MNVTRIAHHLLLSALFTSLSSDARAAETNHVPVIQWGDPAEGFQLGIQFEQETFASGRSIDAKILLRNIAPTNLVVGAGTAAGPNGAFYDGYGLSVQRGAEALRSLVNRVTNPWSTGNGSFGWLTIPPGDVREHEVHLSEEYDLRSLGTYRVCASRQVRRLHGKDVVEITSGFATIRVDTPAPATPGGTNRPPEPKRAAH